MNRSGIALEAIRSRIFSGNLRPGDNISIPNLAKELGVSRQPLNEALKQLQLLSRHCELVACHISDPFETHLPDHNSVIKVDTGNTQSSLPLMNKSFRKQFNNQAQQTLNNRIEMLKKSGLHIFSFSSATPIEQQILGKA